MAAFLKSGNMYKILAASVTGHGANRFKEGDEVPKYRLIEANIPALIEAGAIVEIKPEELDGE